MQVILSWRHLGRILLKTMSTEIVSKIRVSWEVDLGDLSWFIMNCLKSILIPRDKIEKQNESSM